MSALTEKFKNNRNEQRKNLIVYITAGYPDFMATREAILVAQAAGADLIELGIPFSDPIADGPVIQRAAAAALRAGATPKEVLKMVHELCSDISIPIAFMTYINIILNYGPEAFVNDCQAAGVSALIVPDLPAEESGLLLSLCRNHHLDLIPFVAPTSNASRISLACENASGFIYCVANTGVTGVREQDFASIRAVIEKVRACSDVPTAIGFGIGTPQSARQASQFADGVIVGSAVVEHLESRNFIAIDQLLRSMRNELDRKESDHELLSL